nr:serine palmitoyltransferase 1 [Andalucia godoyi]|eukprot:ANDGO_02466.mRNA.1 Long chain base biosynthesis protein 1b
MDSIASFLLQEWEANPYHIILESLFLVFLAYLIPQKVYFQKLTMRNLMREKLTSKEVEALCKEWVPEPLCPVAEANKVADSPVDGPLISAVLPGKVVLADGSERVDMATSNFLALGGDKQILDACESTIRKYGVGTCGPRGFYGTVDVHLALEKRLKEFFRMDSAILYSYDFATIASVIPAFAKRGDHIVLDKGLSMAVQVGCELSRSHLTFFEHNDVNSLIAALTAVNKSISKKHQASVRKYIVIEGLYANSGDIAPLKRIVELGREYKFRVIMDDSFGIGTLGKTGRGTAEHWGMECNEVDMITAGLGNATASVGGFCIGSEIVCDHQRLSGSGYCFSASLPTFLATASIQALDRIDSDPAMVQKLQDLASFAHEQLRLYSDVLTVRGSAPSALIHVDVNFLTQPALRLSPTRVDAVLQQIVDQVSAQDKALLSVWRFSVTSDAPARSTISDEEWTPSIKLCINIKLDKNVIKRVIKTLAEKAKAAQDSSKY